MNAELSLRLNRAYRLVEQDQLEEAQRCCHQVLAALPQSVEALVLAANIARRMGNPHLALDTLIHAKSLARDNATIHLELGAALESLEKRDGAIEAYRRALQLDGSLVEAAINLAAIFQDLDDLDEALACCDQAVAAAPDLALAHFNRATVLRDLARIDEALTELNLAIEIDPTDPRAQAELATCHLLRSNYAAGWAALEARDQLANQNRDHYTVPLYNGGSLVGKSIVVHGEQGVGDEILFASCLPEILRHAGKCIVVCDPRLQSLYARSFPDAVIYGHQRRQDRTPPAIREVFDLQTSCSRLPYFLRARREHFPAGKAYLVPDAMAVEAWQQRYAELGEGLKIGVSWRAGGVPRERRKRTTHLDQWAALLQTKGCQFIDLQYGDTQPEIEELHQSHGLTIHRFTEGDPLLDMDEFAAKVAALDLVISVGNATVHTAGSLGVETWALLPKVPIWRWGLTGERCAWYDSVRLYRQTDWHEWDPVFAQVAKNLRQRAGITTPARPLDNSSAATSKKVEPVTLSAAPVALDPRKQQAADTVKRLGIQEALQQADQQRAAGAWQDAEPLLREILLHAPRHADAFNLLGLTLAATGRVDEGIEFLQKAITICPKEAAYQFNLGSLLMNLNRLSAASNACRKACQLRPQFYQAQLNLGVIEAQLGDLDAARTALLAAARIDPQSGDPLVNLAIALRAAGHLDEAKRCVVAALASDPHHGLAKQISAELGNAAPSPLPLNTPNWNAASTPAARNH